MPALLKLESGAAQLPSVHGLDLSGKSQGEGVGVIDGGFFFYFVTRTSPDHRVKGWKRTIEKGVMTHDHADDDDDYLVLDVHLFGTHSQRNHLYNALVNIQQELRKSPGSLVTSDPFAVFDSVILERYQPDTDTDIKYGHTGKAWFTTKLIFRKMNVAGAADSTGSNGGSAGGSSGTKTLPSVPPPPIELPEGGPF